MRGEQYSLSLAELGDTLKYGKNSCNIFKHLLLAGTVLFTSGANMSRVPGVEAWGLLLCKRFSWGVDVQPRWGGASTPEGQVLSEHLESHIPAQESFRRIAGWKKLDSLQSTI